MHIRCAPAHGLVALAWLSVRCGGVRVLCSFSPPSSPYSGRQGLLLNSFSIELTVQSDGCLIWGLGWWAGLVAGLRVGQAYGVSHRPGFGWVVGISPQILEHPTSICDTGVKFFFKIQKLYKTRTCFTRRLPIIVSAYSECPLTSNRSPAPSA